MQKKNDIFKGLKQKGKMTEKQLIYFTTEHKKTSNLGKMYFFPKNHKISWETSYIELWNTCRKSLGIFR